MSNDKLVTLATEFKAFKAAALAEGNKNKAIPDAIKRDIRAMNKAGFGQRAIAEALGITAGAVNAYVNPKGKKKVAAKAKVVARVAHRDEEEPTLTMTFEGAVFKGSADELADLFKSLKA